MLLLLLKPLSHCIIALSVFPSVWTLPPHTQLPSFAPWQAPTECSVNDLELVSLLWKRGQFLLHMESICRLSNSFWILKLSYFQPISCFVVSKNDRCQATSDGPTQVNEVVTIQPHRFTPYCVFPQVPESRIPFSSVSQAAWSAHGQALPLFSWRPAGKLIWEATHLVPSLFDPKGRNGRAGAGNLLWPGDYRHRADPRPGSRVLPWLLHVNHFPVRFLQWGAIHRLWCPLHGCG